MQSEHYLLQILLNQPAPLRLNGLVMRDAHVRGADLREASLRYGMIVNSNLSEATFAQAEISFTTFDHTNLKGAKFDLAAIYYTTFVHCNLTGTSITDMGYTTFEYCLFDKAVIHLPGYARERNQITFRHIRFDETTITIDRRAKIDPVFENCTYTERTIFPNNFDPVKHGLLLAE
ncbi:MAG TPA: pentapeptide repeat-containing protein [Anaerolineae bacterium]|nr:pentapeptide repeat-containing protein [Anaerolineae bacterium]